MADRNDRLGALRWPDAVRSVVKPRAALARRYIAGATAEAALARAGRLSGGQSIRGSLFVLGEYVSDLATIETTVLEQLSIVALLAGSPLDVHLSVDPTQIGHMLDPAPARRNAFAVAEAIAAGRRTRRASGR